MAGGINPSVRGTDTMASHFRQINQRLATLERAASVAGGGGGGIPPDAIIVPGGVKTGGTTGSDSVGPTSGTTELVVKTLTIPATGKAGYVAAWGTLSGAKTLAADRFGGRIKINGSDRGCIVEPSDIASATSGQTLRAGWTVNGAAVAIDGTTSTVVELVCYRNSGTGTMTLNTGTFTSLNWLFVPDTGGFTDFSELDSRYVNTTGDLMTGPLEFQSVPLSQRLNLYGPSFGIGIQGSTQYFRSSANFAFFKGGVHSDAVLDPGAGGTLQAYFDTNGSLYLPNRAGGINLNLGASATSGPRLRMHLPSTGEICYIDFEGTTAAQGNLYFRSGTANILVLEDTVIRGYKPLYIDFQIRAGGGVQTVLVDNGNGPYLGMYGGADPDNLGSRKGYMGFSSAASAYFNNETAAGHIYISAGPTGGLIIMSPGNAEQARFDSTGIFLLNKTATNATTLGIEMLQTGTVQATRLDAGAPYACNKQVGATSGSPMFAWRVDNVQVGSVSRNAATSAVLYNTTSQIELKGAIKRIKGEDAIALVRQWEPIRFKFRFDKQGRMTRRGTPQRDELAGFDAQKMHRLVPYAVQPGTGTEDEHYAWEKRHLERAAETENWNRRQARYEAACQAHNKLHDEHPELRDSLPPVDVPDPGPPPVHPVDEDTYAPWGMDHSMLVPDLAAAFLGLVERVEKQDDELRELRRLVENR